ncbi:helix-turn-helix domain-containing protein [Bacillaceae bacterium SIJ1]|uniref:helix-turn-helix domain-containing protein n=1 Tax=Litoribacterium kuwaitense TaxID=1398745 RepID=UPI0013EBDB74|nr:helix-turn-helix domain-containing protein [Litoribacterium kuwaitense]NGP44807.1 helix-turn-helix domain-containing protein [Litoribacterium kuwaitense]
MVKKREIAPPPPPSKLVAGHFVNKNEDYHCFRPSGAKNWLLIVSLEGEGEIEIDGMWKSVSRAQAILIPPGFRHAYQTAQGKTWSFLWCHFSQRESWRPWFYHIFSNQAIELSHIQDERLLSQVEAAFFRLFKRQLLTKRFNEELSQNALVDILLLLGEAKTQDSEKVLDSRIQEVLEIFASSYAKKHSLESLGKKVRLSPSRLGHLFKEQVGMSCMEKLQHIRLEQAAKLLLFTEQSIAEISDAVGFTSQSQFSTQFSKYYHCSPSHFRKHRS